MQTTRQGSRVHSSRGVSDVIVTPDTLHSLSDMRTSRGSGSARTPDRRHTDVSIAPSPSPPLMVCRCMSPRCTGRRFWGSYPRTLGVQARNTCQGGHACLCKQWEGLRDHLLCGAQRRSGYKTSRKLRNSRLKTKLNFWRGFSYCRYWKSRSKDPRARA